MPSAKDFCNPMQIVKVEPLAKINAIFFERMRARKRLNIILMGLTGQGEQKERMFDRVRGQGSCLPRLLLNYRRGIVSR